MVRADLPGCGKSYACEYMTNCYKVLFICPTNELTQNYSTEGVTLNRFFGISMNDEETMDKFDHSSYDVIVFDEIYFSSIQKLHNIKKFCSDNPDKIIIATGDTSQLPPITDYTNTKKYAPYADECINNICQCEIMLRENKRLQSQEDKTKLEQFKAELFDKRLDPITTIKKYFQFTNDITKSIKKYRLQK